MMPDVDATDIDWNTAKIVFTKPEFDKLMADSGKKGSKLLCLHNWMERRALGPEEAVIIERRTFTLTNFPCGKVCAKCGAVRLEGPNDKDAPRWKQEELTKG